MAFMQTFQTILITVPNYETVKPYFLNCMATESMRFNYSVKGIIEEEELKGADSNGKNCKRACAENLE